MKSVIQLYYGFIEYLRENKKKISYLQLTGKIEQFLVSEFIYYVYYATNGKMFALSNLGNRNKKERKYDICLLDGSVKERKEKIIGILESKFINNCHRYFVNNSALDSVNGILGSLKTQILPFKGNIHGGYSVKLNSKNNYIYGLVFVSLVLEKENDNKKEKDCKNIKDKASVFKYHDFHTPHFDRVYEDVKVKLVDKEFFVSLRTGLWTLKVNNNQINTKTNFVEVVSNKINENNINIQNYKMANQIINDFNDFIKEFSEKYSVGTEKFLKFWEEIKKIIGDSPGISWKVRTRKTSKYPGIILLNPNNAKNERLMYLFFDDEKIQLAILKKYINGYEHFFPINELDKKSMSPK